MRRRRQCAAISESSRESCGWYRGMNERECHRRECCWASAVHGNGPICYKFDPTIEVEQPLSDSYPLPSYEVTEDVAPRPEPQKYIVESCHVIDFNTPCGPSDVSFENCKAQGCCWVKSDSYNIKCFNSSIISRSDQTEGLTPSVSPTAATASADARPMSTNVYERLREVRHRRPVHSQQQMKNGMRNPFRRRKPTLSMQSGNQRTVPALSTLAEIMIFCGKDSGALCAMTVMSRMGANKIAPSITSPSATNYMNYVLKRTPYTPSPTGTAFYPKTDARTNLIAAPTGDPILDEKCYNTTQFKMFALFHAPCGGFLRPKRIFSEAECINVGCCWVDDYQSILRKALMKNGKNPTLLHHLYPILGINITGGVNCIEALSPHQIAKIGQMAALKSYSQDAEHSSMNSPQLFNMFLDQDDSLSTIMSTMMMVSGNSIPQLSRPMLYSMAQTEDDARVLLPMIYNNIQQDNAVAAPAAESSSKLMGLLPALLMMNSNKNNNESDNDNAFLPMMLATMSSAGQDGMNTGSLSPLLLAMLGAKGGNTDSFLPMALLALSQRTRISSTNRSQEQFQTWAASHPADQITEELPNKPTRQNPQNGILMAMLMSNIMGDDSDQGNKLKEYLPLLLSQTQGSNSPMSSQLGVVLSALFSNQDDTGMMMQLLSNPEISRNPQLMALLLSKVEGDSEESLSPMMMYALSQSTGNEANGGMDMMTMILPMLLNGKDSKNSSSSINQMLPLMLQSMQQSNPSSQSQILSMALTNPSIVTENPGLIASLLNRPTAAANSPTSFNSNAPPNNLPLPVLMSLLSGKPLDPLTLLSITGSGLQNQGQGVQSPGFSSMGSTNLFGSPAFSNLGYQTGTQAFPNPGLSSSAQPVLGSGSSSTDNAIISLLMNSIGGTGNTAGIQTVGQTSLPGYPQVSSDFNNFGFHQPIDQLQQTFMQPEYSDQTFMQQQGFNSNPSITPFNPFAPQASGHLQPLPVNPFSNPNFGQPANEFAPAILSGRDSEHSSSQSRDECNFPPEAETSACQFDESQAITEANCLANQCCWNAEGEPQCFKTVSQT